VQQALAISQQHFEKVAKFRAHTNAQAGGAPNAPAQALQLFAQVGGRETHGGEMPLLFCPAATTFGRWPTTVAL
jgi:hypothetical protein